MGGQRETGIVIKRAGGDGDLSVAGSIEKQHGTAFAAEPAPAFGTGSIPFQTRRVGQLKMLIPCGQGGEQMTGLPAAHPAMTGNDPLYRSIDPVANGTTEATACAWFGCFRHRIYPGWRRVGNQTFFIQSGSCQGCGMSGVDNPGATCSWLQHQCSRPWIYKRVAAI